MSYNINNKTKNQANYNYTLLFILGFFTLALLINLVKLVRQYLQRQQTLITHQQELKETQMHKDKLEYKLKQSKTRDYIEKQARKLNLSKTNELIVLVPSLSPTPKLKLKPTPKTPNYKLWIKLFIKK